jgi:hypothetical protein
MGSTILAMSLDTAAGRAHPARYPTPDAGHLDRPTLLALSGVGVDTAGQLLVTAGDNPHRLRGEASFAHLCDTAPIPASSGRTHRHRLNRGGDRQANHALWRIALVRMRCHPPTRAYVERRTKQGLSKLDIMRCLNRYIAREAYHQLTSLPPRLPPLARNRRHQLPHPHGHDGAERWHASRPAPSHRLVGLAIAPDRPSLRCLTLRSLVGRGLRRGSRVQ